MTFWKFWVINCINNYNFYRIEITTETCNISRLVRLLTTCWRTTSAARVRDKNGQFFTKRKIKWKENLSVACKRRKVQNKDLSDCIGDRPSYRWCDKRLGAVRAVAKFWWPTSQSFSVSYILFALILNIFLLQW